MKNFKDILYFHATNNPNRIAIQSMEMTVTYGELYQTCLNVGNFIHQNLESQNSKSSFVPLILNRSPHVPIAIHSLYFIDKAYVPIDPNFPDERISYILKDVGSSMVITNKEFVERIKKLGNYQVLDIESLITVKMPDTYKLKDYNPHDPCYIIYTSGTTGNPKGVVNLKKGLMNRIAWMRDHYNLNDQSIFILKTPYTFDVSVCELTLPFLLGAKLVVGGPKVHQKINELIKLITTYKVTDIRFVPSVMHLFLNFIEGKDLSSLVNVYCSGEGLSTELTKRFFNTTIRAQLHNLYGPTEASVEVSYYECSPHDHQKYATTPIGKAISQTYFHIVDEYGKQVVDGEKGELLIGGIGVADCYYNLPELTAQKFIDDPFNPHLGKMFRSGDLVRKNNLGEIEFFGRLDHQVKINGQRVELGEIENHLSKIEELGRVAVLFEKNQLFAFIEKKKSILEEKIFEKLKMSLPTYMIPAKLFVLDELPLSTSGKIDRKELKNLLIN